jgi:hypothetical protein
MKTLLLILSAILMNIGTSFAGDSESAAQQAPAPAVTEANTASSAEQYEDVPAGAHKPPEPIVAAFGIPLGERFELSMVSAVLEEQEQTYRSKEDTEYKGKLLHVEPREPDERFQRYSINISDQGVIYAIQGDGQIEPRQGNKLDKAKHGPGIRKRCKDAAASLAAELEDRYGKPRGKGWGGEWFSFRQISDEENRSTRLYAHRCRSGIYTVIYSDEKVWRAPKQGSVAVSPRAGTPSMDPVPVEAASQTRPESGSGQ